MGIIKANHKIASVVHHSFQLLPVLNRFGIRLGVKEKTIEEICEEKGLNLHFVLAIINAYHNESYFPEKELQSIPAKEIIRYLRKTHDYYINYILKHIDTLLVRFIESEKGDKKELKIIETFYSRYKEELVQHINDEEKDVFPYVLRLEAWLEDENTHKEFNEPLTIEEYEKEHSNVDEKLNDLKNLLIKFVEPNYDDNLCNTFLSAIYQFEKDLKDHSRIEDLILVPKVMDMEKQVKYGR